MGKSINVFVKRRQNRMVSANVLRNRGSRVRKSVAVFIKRRNDRAVSANVLGNRGNGVGRWRKSLESL